MHSKSNPEDKDAKRQQALSLSDRLKDTSRRYGKIALIFHSSIYAATYSLICVAISEGVEIAPMLDYIPFLDMGSNWMNPAVGNFALAYVATAATGPFRGLLTIGASPIIARIWRRK